MNANIASLRAPGPIRDSGDLQEAFALFNRVSTELTDSYRLLERRVEELSSELEQVDRARLRELEEKERVSERLRSLLDLLPAGVVVLDRRGIVCDSNPAAGDMLPGVLRGQRWLDVIRKNFAPRKDDGHEISLQGGRRVSVATRSLEKDFGQVVLLTDQTETRDLQDRLSRHQRLTAMGRMMAALAHQIRTPLAAAMLYASNLCEADLAPEQIRKFSGKILSRLSHLEQQVRDMLIFVRGDVQLGDRPSIAQLAEAIHSAMEEPLRANRSRCEWRLDCDGAASVVCNRDVLVGAVINLVNNAIQASGPGADIAVQITRGEDRLRIQIIDTGPGMSLETLRQLEDGFFTTKAAGTGLGVAVARSIARAHRGDLVFQTALGQGTVATIVLPLNDLVIENGADL